MTFLKEVFGLVWGNSEKSEDELDYYKLNISYKLSTYLAAGLPVVVPDYLSNADYVREHGLGFVVSSLEEADRCVQECTEEQYARWLLTHNTLPTSLAMVISSRSFLLML